MKLVILIFVALITVSFTIVPINERCNPSNCKNPNGECIDSICLCAAGYTSATIQNNFNIFDYIHFNKQIQLDSKRISLCNYQLRYKYYAANIEAIFPFGAGHFYTGRYLHAFIKFILFWFLSFNRVLFKKRISRFVITEKAYQLSLWIFVTMYLIDFAGFIFSYYKDGNGMMLLD